MRTPQGIDQPSLAAPPHLSAKSRKLWAEIVPRRAKSPERLQLLVIALQELDRADAAKAILDKEGLTFATLTSGSLHVRPEVRVERDARASFVRVWRLMSLEWCYPLDGKE